MKTKNINLEIVKTINKANREIEIELYGKSINHFKIQKSKKLYNRKNKHKGSSYEDPFFFCLLIYYIYT